MSLAVATFGAGGAEPYASALRGGDLLYLSDTRTSATTRVTMDVSRWNADADHVDLTLLSRVTGPVLDIGCGPGRMVRAAMNLGMHAVGIDVSAAALEIAGSLGGSFFQGSVFDRVPGEGMWQTTLLVDGNVGIGGDIPSLLARCRDLLSATGEIVIELNADASHEEHYFAEVVDSHGNRSDSFPWAEIGLDRLCLMLDHLGLELVQSWEIDGRAFCRLAKIT
ncbi:class I SAM-dependent methyltransferase [Salinibacterium sp. G-O1]|uniref:class I SAM-dependent methyltransferase n=1 Tax=Salinibacterium sp. G-O1 TaxID=3046208 RepID=UPI0024B8A3C0|nr:class I SAM-dependent methyltransferase [Salinibacterium sp. G-O1]MDJ0335927.1 class I SAM-dependent methyltransferase [Salinibacterium sp. G-O1]